MPPLRVVAETLMKSGEEWSLLFTSPNALFIGGSEGWVKSEEFFMTPLFIQFSESRIPGDGLVFLSLMEGLPCRVDSQLADMETAGCSR